MISAPVTAITPNRTGALLPGNYTELIAVLPKEAEQKVRHTFSRQTICVEPINGHLGVMLPDRRVILKPGQKFKIPMNTEHAFYNADEGDVAFREYMKPALHTSWMIREMAAVEQRRPSRWKARFEKAYIFNQVRNEYRHSGIPQFLHKYGYALMARVGKWLGLVKAIQPFYS